MTAMVFFIAVAATAFSYVFRYFGGDTLVLELLRGLGFGDWGMLLIALNLQTSFLTPPFGFALFFLKGAAPPSVALRDIYQGIVRRSAQS